MVTGKVSEWFLHFNNFGFWKWLQASYVEITTSATTTTTATAASAPTAATLKLYLHSKFNCDYMASFMCVCGRISLKLK
jgi:hypothetical protein